LAKQPQKIITVGQESYAPKPAGAKAAEYDGLDIMNKPDLPEVAPPSGGAGSALAAQVVFASGGPVDPNAPDILKVIQGSKFKTPFTVTLMRREGQQVFKSDAGTKTEDKYVLVKETVKDPADLLRLGAAIKMGAYKALNDNSLEFQFMMFLAVQNGAL
jgi:hypothetical protein